MSPDEEYFEEPDVATEPEPDWDSIDPPDQSEEHEAVANEEDVPYEAATIEESYGEESYGAVPPADEPNKWAADTVTYSPDASVTYNPIEEFPEASTPTPSNNPESKASKNESLKSMIKDLKAKTLKKQTLQTAQVKATNLAIDEIFSKPQTDQAYTNVTVSAVKKGRTLVNPFDTVQRVEAQHFTVNIDDVMIDYAVEDPATEVTPICKSFIPSDGMLRSIDGLPSDWKFDGTFNHPICTNSEATAEHGTKVCSYAGNFQGCSFFNQVMPTPIKQFLYDDHEVYILAEMPSKFGTKEHAIFLKNTFTGSYQTYRISSATSSALQVWDELVSSFGATVEEREVPVDEKISFLAGMVA